MLIIVVTIIGLVLAGLLAGEEFVVRYGVQPALSSLDDRAHLSARIALVRRLMVVVPSIMVPTVLLNALALILGGADKGLALRIAGVAALVAFLLIAFLGTVPINIRVNDTWTVDAPPADWKEVVQRWELIDTFRSSAAIVAFALLVIGAVI